MRPLPTIASGYRGMSTTVNGFLAGIRVSPMIPCSSTHYLRSPVLSGKQAFPPQKSKCHSLCKSSYNWTNIYICTLEWILFLIHKIFRYLVTAVATSSSLFCTKTQKSWFRTTGRKFIITWIFSILSKFCNGCEKENERFPIWAMKPITCFPASAGKMQCSHWCTSSRKTGQLSRGPVPHGVCFKYNH